MSYGSSTTYYIDRAEMATSMYISFVLLLLTSSSSAITTLESLCGNLGGGYIDYNTCMSGLGADPRSRSATDFPTLASISIDLCVNNATNVKSKVMQLLTNGTATGTAKNGLSSCLTLYSNVIPALRWSSDAIAAKRYGDASDTITAAVGVASACDDGFGQCDGGNESPLLKENSGFSGVAVIAQAIAQVLSLSS